MELHWLSVHLVHVLTRVTESERECRSVHTLYVSCCRSELAPGSKGLWSKGRTGKREAWGCGHHSLNTRKMASLEKWCLDILNSGSHINS